MKELLELIREISEAKVGSVVLDAKIQAFLLEQEYSHNSDTPVLNGTCVDVLGTAWYNKEGKLFKFYKEYAFTRSFYSSTLLIPANETWKLMHYIFHKDYEFELSNSKRMLIVSGWTMPLVITNGSLVSYSESYGIPKKLENLQSE